MKRAARAHAGGGQYLRIERQLGRDREHGVDRAAGRDHEDDAARALQGGDEVLQLGRRNEGALVAVVLDQRLGAARGAGISGA